MDRLGCAGILLVGLIAAIALMPIAGLLIRSSDDGLIATAAYAELALSAIAGGVFLAFRQSDLAEGLAYAVGAAAVVYVGVLLSFNTVSNGQYGLPDNPFFSHYIGIPLVAAAGAGGFLLVQ
jgi:hypothetical protein